MLINNSDYVGYNLPIKKISATDFKAHCLALIDEMQNCREPVIVTKRGKPWAKLVPVGSGRAFFGRLKGVIRVVGDIESPMEP